MPLENLLFTRIFLIYLFGGWSLRSAHVLYTRHAVPVTEIHY